MDDGSRILLHSGDVRLTPRSVSSSAVIFALVIAEVTSAFETTMVLSALTRMIGHFGDPIGVGWMVTGYLLVATAASAIASGLGDIFGRRRVLLVVLALAAAGSVISFTTEHLGLLIAGRCLQGVAGAILPLCFALARVHLPTERLSSGVGTIAATASLASGLGLVAGGLIVDLLSWHFIFFVSATAATVSLFVCIWLIPADAARSNARRIDVPGLLFAPAIGGVLLAISSLSSPDKTHVALFGGAGLVLLAIWTSHELRTPQPLINLRLLRHPAIAACNLCLLLVGLGALQPQFLLILMQQPVWTGIGLGVSASVASLVKSPAQMVGGVGSYLAGRAGMRLSSYRLLLIAAALIFLGVAGIAMFHTTLAGILIFYAVTGLGVGVLMTACPLMILQAAPADRAAEATGLASVARYLGTSIGAQVIAVVLASSRAIDPEGKPSAYADADAFRLGFTYMLVLSGAALVVALLAQRHRTGR